MGIDYIYKICGACGGTGDGQESVTHDEGGNKVTATPDNCEQCDGTGKMLWGNIQNKLEGEE